VRDDYKGEGGAYIVKAKELEGDGWNLHYLGWAPPDYFTGHVSSWKHSGPAAQVSHGHAQSASHHNKKASKLKPNRVVPIVDTIEPPATVADVPYAPPTSMVTPILDTSSYDTLDTSVTAPDIAPDNSSANVRDTSLSSSPDQSASDTSATDPGNSGNHDNNGNGNGNGKDKSNGMVAFLGGLFSGN
jgi:hypothetical protein